MNKYKQLTKKITKTGISAAIVIGIAVAIYVGISMFSDSVAEERKKYEDKLAQDKSLLADLRNQMDKSGVAEKRYLAIQADRSNQNFAATMDGAGGLNDFLRDAKTRYHFNKLTIKPVKEVPSDKSELANVPFSVLLRPHLEIKFEAVSDAHVFSFLDDLRRAAPGFVYIDKMELKRVSEMTDATITQMQSGTSPILVNATVEFTWIRIIPKETKDAKSGVAGSRDTPGAP